MDNLKKTSVVSNSSDVRCLDISVIVIVTYTFNYELYGVLDGQLVSSLMRWKLKFFRKC